MVFGLASATPLLLLTGLIAGIRHGIDWDHIAAISDITSTQSKARTGIFMSLVVTNTLMGVLAAYGYIKSSQRQRLYRSAAFVTGSFSIVLGVLFLFGGVSYLPNLEAYRKHRVI